jgi:hypothetical protein
LKHKLDTGRTNGILGLLASTSVGYCSNNTLPASFIEIFKFNSACKFSTNLGNSVDFGDLTQERGTISACASSTRGTWAAGDIPGTNSNVIDYITIMSTGNAIDFGDLLITGAQLSACSNGHGGL